MNSSIDSHVFFCLRRRFAWHQMGPLVCGDDLPGLRPDLLPSRNNRLASGRIFWLRGRFACGKDLPELLLGSIVFFLTKRLTNVLKSGLPTKTTICTVPPGDLRRRNQTKRNLSLAFQFVCVPPSPRAANKLEGKWKVRTTKNHQNRHLCRMQYQICS